MHRLMILLFAVLLFAGFGSVAIAQSSDDATISATANVTFQMSVGAESNDLIFDAVATSSSKSITPTGTVSTGNRSVVTGNEEAGFVTIDVIEGVMVDLTIEAPNTLILNGSTGGLGENIGFTFNNVAIQGIENDDFRGFVTTSP